MKIVLVHGSSHGAWCWYKVAAILRSQGYSITAVDLAACGADPRRMGDDVASFDEYTKALTEFMASVPEGEKVVLVGHSFAGLSLAAAMDAFPLKVAVAVFVTAILPDTVHSPSYIFQKLFEKSPYIYSGIERQNIEVAGRSEPFIITKFDPKFLQSNLYQNCSFEDLTLANMLVRPGSLFEEDLNKTTFSSEGFGFVDKVFILCGEDALITVDFQKWMVENSPVNEVMMIENADHMPMLSKPQELCQCLTNIFSNYEK